MTSDNSTGLDGLSLRPATRTDWPLIRSWISQPDIQHWRGNPSAAEAEVRIAQNSAQALSWLIVLGAERIGYGHAIDATYWGATLPQGMPAGAWEIDLFIGEPRQRGKGYGERALSMIAEEVFSTTLAVAVCAIVSVRREAAVRIYERAGFAWAAVFEDPIDGPSWLMTRFRS